ncbi:hypothetical protein [Bacillus anthracis]|uniref:hypothetical protein n=1 Tax=Bacillus anthracis TaxID=1392 RepID=UPI000BF3CA7D|nr:hypothetical protein [Bacillus anthracis]PGB55449.1 hypothetical protein COL95_06450 [Bacillus anthracis]
MNYKKMLSIFMTSIFTVGLLIGCNPAPKDEKEPDPTEEPSEQRQEEKNEKQDPAKEQNNELNKKDEQEPDPTEEPSEEQKKKMSSRTVMNCIA